MWPTHSIFNMRIDLKILFLLLLLMSPTLIFSQDKNNFEKVEKVNNVSVKGFNEISPLLIRDGLIFCSDITEASAKAYSDENGDPFYNIYISRKDEDGSFKKPELFSEDLTTLQYDGPVSFNSDEDFLVFSRNLELTSFGNNKKGNPNVGLFFAELINGKWTNIVPFDYNDLNAQTSHPSLSADGSTLYFSSNREGGFGGWDLYVSMKQGGRWAEPKNLGPVINTANNEIFPFLHSSGRLYFSSDGHDNVNGYDLFYSDYYQNKWFGPFKLPGKINSPLNDISIYLNDDYTKGFFTRLSREKFNDKKTYDIWSYELTLPSFEVTRQQVVNNYCFVFFEENTMELDSSVYIYEWDMGDNSKVRAVEAQHCYVGPGDYLVQLNVVDKLTNMVEFNQAEYLVQVEKVIQPYITCPDTIILNQPTLFIANQESFFGEGVEHGPYIWDFGDGHKSIGDQEVYTYTVPGHYKIKLGTVEVLPAVNKNNRVRSATKGDPEISETPRRFSSYKSIIVIEPNKN
jgi:hypothetical protein